MSRFQTTRWSLIEAAHATPEVARPALERLCCDYRPPVLAYVRHSGYRAGDAEDLTQAFFLHVLEHGWYTHADPARGRFRALLLTSLRHFMADHEEKIRAAKRGGGTHADADALEQIADDHSPEQAFIQAWLASTLARAMDKLQYEWELAGKREQFDRIAPLLAEHAGPGELHEVADALGIRCNTLSVQAHRMRQRLRQLVRLELVQTVGSREALEEELTELRAALDVLP